MPSESIQRPQIVLVAVEHKEIGSIEVATTDGDTLYERVIALDMDCLVGQTGAPMPITLVIPTSAGPDLLRNILTDDQWDAVCDA